MTVFSVAQASRHLGIDAKTFHRWLAEAQFPLQCHPLDGRKKGVSFEQLQTLARLHQRSLAPQLQQEPTIPQPAEMPPLPASLWALPEHLCALQNQIAALHQQVAELTDLLQQQRQGPRSPQACPPPPPSTKRLAKPAPRSRLAAKAPSKPVHVIPRVEYSEQGHYVVICPKKGLLPFEPDTQQWFAWVTEQSSFRFVGKGGHFTAHHWWRVPRGAWRAHRSIRNHNYVLRLAPNYELTIAVLEQAAEALQAHLT